MKPEQYRFTKLDFDMRAAYDALLQQPLPERHSSLLKDVPGSQRDVIDVTHPIPLAAQQRGRR